MLLELGSVILATMMLVGTAAIVHGQRNGWLYLCLMQLPATVYDVLTRQWGFILTGLVGAVLYWRGWRRRRVP